MYIVYINIKTLLKDCHLCIARHYCMTDVMPECTFYALPNLISTCLYEVIVCAGLASKAVPKGYAGPTLDVAPLMIELESFGETTAYRLHSSVGTPMTSCVGHPMLYVVRIEILKKVQI